MCITFLPLLPPPSLSPLTKMNGYSKMKDNGNAEPRSIDHPSPDRSPFPPTTPISDPSTPLPNLPPSTTQTEGEPADPAAPKPDPLPKLEPDQAGPKLRRNSSVSSAYALQAAVKRAFSMQRSASVSERYSRIHDQSVGVGLGLEAAVFEQEEAEVTAGTERSAAEKKKKRSLSKGKILKAWKKLFGL